MDVGSRSLPLLPSCQQHQEGVPAPETLRLTAGLGDLPEVAV